ncbi:hypothetical protein MLD38_017882 [Melastoma candidum]|uniref:Uncharacterized protein n=1 Tax=Melastoma candidum TaxID=119954 RepID=A0ACB9QS52_9MYRT|nr:hypothetical protein MLD38_017882 [Melastoma candidum]
MDPELYKAARSGDVIFLHGINRCLTFFSQTTPKGNTILHVAAEFGHPDFFKEAVNLCPSLFGDSNAKGETTLHVAARVGCSEVVDFVIARAKTLFADAEKANSSYLSFRRQVDMGRDNALHSAARNVHLAVAKSLIEADPRLLDFVNDADESPFYITVAKEHQGIAKLILSKCVSCLYGGANGMTALHAALYYQLNETIKEIVRKRSHMIGEADALGWTPLHYAAHFGNVKAAQLFLRYDSSAAYITGKDGNRPFILLHSEAVPM